MKDRIFSPVGMLLFGCVMGALAKLSDVYFRVSYFQMSLSELTSQMSIWIVLGVAISLFSGSRKLAMANVFLFCAGMLAATTLRRSLPTPYTAGPSSRAGPSLPAAPR